jgi:prostamide/prostaglandin F2alpha synthase
VQLHRDRKKFEEAGVRLAVIGQGRAEHARHFREQMKVDLPIYVSGDRAAYEAAGAKVGTFSELLGPKSVIKGIRRSASERVVQGRTVGHPAQLGGVLVVKPDASIPYAHLADDASDNPANEEVLEAARAAAG